MYPTLDILRERITQQFMDAGFTAAPDPASPEYILIENIAVEQFNAYNQAYNLINSLDPSLSHGADLDAYGELRGMPRAVAQVATDATRQNVYFEISAGGDVSYTVPVNTRVRTAANIEYTTTESITIDTAGPDGRMYVKVKATGIGDGYNIEANSLQFHDSTNKELIVGNVLPIETGSSVEVDDDYRPRLLRYWSILRNTNLIALEARLRAIPNVAVLSLKPHTYGVGSVSAFIQSTNPITGPALIAQVQAEAQRGTAGGVRVFVEYPDHLFYICTVEVITKDLVSVKPLVRAAVREYVNKLALGEILIFSQLKAEVISVPGVIDAQFTLVERGVYDVQNQTVQFKQTIGNTNQPASLNQKWVTADEYIEVCEAGG